MKKISIVVPCYNEQEVLPLFYIEIQKVMQQIQEEHPDTGFELLFINDGSRDGTLAKLRELARGDERVRYISSPGTSERNPVCTPVWKMPLVIMLSSWTLTYSIRRHFCRRCTTSC